MRKKLVSKTYMRGVSDWDIVISKRLLENYCITIKRINHIDIPFIVEHNNETQILIDDGYFIIEYTPLNKFYNARAYMDKDLHVIEYYFDMSKNNGINDNIPYYDDLYLDLIYGKNGLLIVDDEDELLQALYSGVITKEDFDIAKKTCSELIAEINEKRNEFINFDKRELIKKYFGQENLLITQ